jgi:hydroxymethylbilane synthase
VPIAGLALVGEGRVKMEGLVGTVDGTRLIRERIEGPEEEAAQLGIELANVILDKGGREILREIYEAEEQ